MEKWTKEQESYLVENYMSTDYKTLSNILDKTEGAIRAKCFDLKLIKKNKWTEEEITFLKENYSKMSKEEISKYLNRTDASIKVKANKLGLKKYPYNCNYTFFKNIDSESKAYWLGFIYADGWITKNDLTNSGHLGIQLQKSDTNHLKKFNKDISGNYPILFGEKTCKVSTKPDTLHQYCLIRIFSIDLVNDLISQGITSDKSYHVIFPNINENLMGHFIRGFFDGDGCVRSRIRKLASGENKKIPACDITCHDITFLENIRKILYKNNIHSYIYPDKTNYRLYMSGFDDNVNFLDYIYENSSVYLDRKYKKYQEIKEYIKHDCLAN